jgi:hypothetical protein
MDEAQARFERWATTDFDLKRRKNGEYVEATEAAWWAWQASRTAALEEAAQVCETVRVERYASISHDRQCMNQRAVTAAAIRALKDKP